MEYGVREPRTQSDKWISEFLFLLKSSVLSTLTYRLAHS